MGHRKPVIGLAGGIAAGKSLVAQILETLGAGVIRSDDLNHQVLRRSEVREQIERWWGPGLYDDQGRPDRQRLAAIVFEDETQRKRLEGLTHPLIARLRQQLMERYQADPNIQAIVLDIPLLFEVNKDDMCDRIIFVEADERVRIERVCRDRGWSGEELRRRQNLQNPLDSKRERADYIVENNSDINMLRQAVARIYQQVISSQ